MHYNRGVHAEFKELEGRILTAIERNTCEDGFDRLIFICDDGTRFEMGYVPDCCAQCHLNDVCGDIFDLIDSRILKAYESTDSSIDADGYGRHTWTFYHISTNNGSVTLRWLGTSNGYYSESVTFRKLTSDG